MGFEDFFKMWDKLSSIKPDFILFVGFIFIVFKFKDVVDTYYKIKFHQSERLKEAKLLLELSGNANSSDMQVIKYRLRDTALILATNGVNSRYRELCFYFMDLSSRHEMHADEAIFKCVRFVVRDDEQFLFDNSSYRRWFRACVFATVFITFFLLFASGVGWGDNPEIFNLSWLMNVTTATFIAYSGYFYLFLKPSSGDVKIINELLLKARFSDFKKFKKDLITSII